MKTRVLLVDDDPAQLAELARIIEEIGYEPVPVSSSTDALREFREGPPDAVLLDVMMPTLDGFKLARLLKTESTSFVPIILLTALTDLESKRRGMAAGADDFLVKPVASVELQIRLGAMLRIKELTDQLHEVNAKLAQLAVTDSLTGLLNRGALYAQLDRELRRAQRYQHPLSLLMIDLDHFKDVNDRHGHPAGDRLLRRVAEIIVGSIRGSDVAGRFGGEEFMVIAPETGRDAVRVVAARIRAAVESTTAASGLAVTVSIGAMSDDTGAAASPDELIAQADQALYRAKEQGRNRFVIGD